MAESMLITCPAHSVPLVPSLMIPGNLGCPEPDCGTVIHITAPEDYQPSPLTYLEVGAAERHELVRAHQAVGFSRSEAMQVMLTVVTATIMKDRGSGDE